MRSRLAPPATIDEYLARLDPAKRAALQKVRTAIHAAAPGAEECISYGVPAFRHGGRVLMHMGAAAGHCALYPGARPVRVLAAELATYDTSKGTLRFAPERPLPAALVRKLVKARLAEYAEAAAGRAAKAKPAAKPRRDAVATRAAKRRA
jgi:uncharacterized protein YdhG (YjbR/CyaY superfamily)